MPNRRAPRLPAPMPANVARSIPAIGRRPRVPAAHAELSALDSEAVALAKATRREGRDRLLDQLRADPGYERALAAALGDDLEAGLDAAAERFWAGAEAQPGDPGAPAGTVALAEHVAAPPALARRLAQIFVADADGGEALAVGQRLVTTGGVLRRWDGYVAKSGGAAAAERLVRMNRLRAIEAARPAAVRAVDAADAELTRIDDTIAEARRAAADARRVLEAAETSGREAARSEDRAAVAIERHRGAACRSRRRAGGGSSPSMTKPRAKYRVPRRTGRRSPTAARRASGWRSSPPRRKRSAPPSPMRGRIARGSSGRSAQDRERLAANAAEGRGWRSRAGEAARRIAEMDKRDADLAAEADALAGRPDALAGEIAALEEAHGAARGRSRSPARRRARRRGGPARNRDGGAGRRAKAWPKRARRAPGATARAENQDQRRIEMGRLSGERFECPPPVLLPERVGFDGEAVRSPQDESAQHDKLLLDRERIGPVNLVAETELAELEAASLGNAAEREELGLAVNRLRGSIGTLNREGRQRLLAAFEAVNGHFRRLFTTLFNGGQAHLELIDSDDPLEAGLEIMAQPPGKKLQSLTLLSGGEQALTAVALIFGLFLTNPAPICVLDEVDAPLDDANIERFCDLLDAMTRETADALPDRHP